MELLLKEFEVEHKNSSKEALRRWRYAVSVVTNPGRRFRFVADLVKRSEAEKKSRKVQVLILLFFSFAYILVQCSACCVHKKHNAKRRRRKYR